METLLAQLLITCHLLSLALAQVPIEIQKEFFEITAYTASEEETDSTPKITANGTQVREGIIACSRRFEFGTRFIINEKEYVCTDRLAKKYDHRLDVFMDSREEAIRWGKQTLEVAILSK